MNQLVVVFIAAVVAAHGIIHLLGFVAYWPIAQLKELPYKTELLGGRWQLSPTGMRLYSVLWLLAAAAFVACATGLALRLPWWPDLILASAALSAAICALDWQAARIGVLVDLLAVALAVAGPRLLA